MSLVRVTVICPLLLALGNAFEIWGSGPTTSSTEWSGWDLELLNGTTSLIFSDMPVEEAHKHGINYFTTCGPTVAAMENATSRAAFAASCAKSVVAAKSDGANFDYEDPIPFGSPLVQKYTINIVYLI